MKKNILKIVVPIALFLLTGGSGNESNLDRVLAMLYNKGALIEEIAQTKHSAVGIMPVMLVAKKCQAEGFVAASACLDSKTNKHCESYLQF